MAEVSTRVRVGLVVLAVPQLVTGSWAVLAPRSWFDGFPGIGADLVAAEPPFNLHLATDAGAGFLASGVVLIAAALLGQRSGAFVGLVAYAAFGIPHVIYHLDRPADALSRGEQVTAVALLGFGLAFAAVLAVMLRREQRKPGDA